MSSRVPEKLIGCSLVNPPAGGAFKLDVFVKPTDPADADSPLWPIVGTHRTRDGAVFHFTMLFGLPIVLPDEAKKKMFDGASRWSLPSLDPVRLSNHHIEAMWVDVYEDEARVSSVGAIVKHMIATRTFYTHEVVPLTNEENIIAGKWTITPWSLKAAALKNEEDRVKKLPANRHLYSVMHYVTAAYNSALRTESAQTFVDQLVAVKRVDDERDAEIAATVPVGELDQGSFAQRFARRMRS